jgi:hypothetical protein
MSFLDNDSNERGGLENEALQLLNAHHITADPTDDIRDLLRLKTTVSYYLTLAFDC